MVKMVSLISLFYLLLHLTSTAKAQEPAVLESLPTDQTLQPPSLSAAVHLPPETLQNVSGSVLAAESWLRDYVLPNYPSTNVTAILVGHSVFCSQNQRRHLASVLPAIRNIHHSLTRWGLQDHIKPTTSFSSECLHRDDDLADHYVRPLLTLLQDIGSPYVVNPPRKASSFLEPHLESLKKLGNFHLGKVSMVISRPRNQKLTTRKLSSVAAADSPLPPLIGTFPPLQEPSPSSALPPLIGTFAPLQEPSPRSPPPHPMSPPFQPPMVSPGFGHYLPPCEPSGGAGPPAHGGHAHHGVWCVAKPSVPSETLQESLDFACGEGGADCEAISEDGSCYFPDSVVAHASYAFNSYWQKNKKSGGTCGFGGTAMLIASDPSYRQCRFVLT